MTEYDIKRLAEILAIQATIEGMKIANIEREMQDYAPKYNEAAFMDAAEELRVMASKHDENL